MDAPQLQANLPTPWMGVWERVSIFAYKLWQMVFAITLLRVRETVVRAVGREVA